MKVVDVRFGHHRASDTVIGFDDPTPSLSWRVQDAPAGWHPTRARIEVTDRNGNARVHEIDDADGVHVPWPAAPLSPLEHATVRIGALDADGAWSAWSDPATVECGLLDKADWRAVPVTPSPSVGREDPAPVLVRRFTVGPDARDARLTITVGGILIAYIDGRRVGRDELAPGWTEYDKRITASTHDVTDMLTPGEHEISVVLGNGWWRGNLTWAMRTNVYGDDLWLLADLRWTDADGTHAVGTDETWTWRASNILANDLYQGQDTDTRRPPLGDPDDERPVRALPMPEARIVPRTVPPARIIDELPAQEIITTPSGRTIIDFGQNATGWVRLTVRGGRAGDTVTLRHAEVLEHGELGVRPLRGAKATDTFILDGSPEQILEPQLTQHGFRYAEIQGVTGLAPEDATLRVLSADMDRLARFDCSDPQVNRLFLNAVWSTIGNFITIPTDCPQRDERLGWTGDIAVYAPTATRLMDCAGFLASWLTDVESDRGEDGGIPVVVPQVLDGPQLTCGWGDAAVLVPWAIYETTGDTGVFADNIAMMDAFIDGVDALTGGTHIWAGGFQFGDWLDPTAPPDNPGGSKADPDVVATSYFAHSTRLVARAHEALGDTEGARRYAKLADEIARAFRDEYVTAGGRVLSDCASVYAMAIAWDLLEPGRQSTGAADRLADIVRTTAFRVSTGFLGTPLVCPALARSGHMDLAMRLLLERGCPSWLYPVTMGATTVWERWDSMLPNGDINPGEMTSFNHYALGAIAGWLISGVAGLSIIEPGYRTVGFTPRPTGDLSHATASQTTPYGTIDTAWRVENDTMSATITLPAGITAEVTLPDGTHATVGHGTHTWTIPFIRPERHVATIRDLIDDRPLFDDLRDALRRCGNPMYAGDDADAVFAANARAYLDDPVSELPTVASARGYCPMPDLIVNATDRFMAEHHL
ncbi:alpha-L-rhamnosidase [Bifidobacterium vansinderenii]|uniref:alpha-L-rhamnosidase n=1 Tax=Bifidobacterium vansinderenii TaxID=1984871 RepID=A0A229W051_9BIFI|nr:alpha-L-rhamnosidase [Bifidobacterium vansinderenii]OXN01231.1 Alpha-L-rhamnosidase [Bifidobacterium vansinderenii]